MSPGAKTRAMPAPGIGPDNEAFVAAAGKGRFVLPFCDDCGKSHWYPRAVCPHCWSTKTTWRTASGRGTVYSYSTMQRVDPPYTPVLKRLTVTYETTIEVEPTTATGEHQILHVHPFGTAGVDPTDPTLLPRSCSTKSRAGLTPRLPGCWERRAVW